MGDALKKISFHPELLAWVQECIKWLEPESVYLCDGSEKEAHHLTEELLTHKTFKRLSSLTHPGSYLACSSPDDVARIEDRTFICSQNKDDAGPTNNWEDPAIMKERLHKLFHGSMRGRTLYIIPYSMGPLHSPLAKIGVQITDSPYVVLNMRIMTRIGEKVLKELKTGPFVKCLHSVGYPLTPHHKEVPWPCDTEHRYIVHFPEEMSVWSYGSGYGGNALLGKKCFALRLASVLAKEEGWLAEHMLIVGVTNPEGKKRYFAAAFPSACGKTNLAMLTPTLPHWKIETVGDDIAWMKFDKEGTLRAINPEAGFFGVASGTSLKSNPNAMKTIEKNTIFTNVALTDDGDVWWEGKTDTPPDHLINWLGHDWTPASKEKAAHPNSRFTVAASQCPVIDPLWESPEGVPISAIIFGGRRGTTIPLVYESFSWNHGVFLGASISSEMTAAASGVIGTLRHDPFAMLPFCGYHMGDYFKHWLDVGKVAGRKLPKIYAVNWFKKNSEGQYLWPGYGENSRVLKWIFHRLENESGAVDSPIGKLPVREAFDTTGLSINKETMDELFSIDRLKWMDEVNELHSYFKRFNPKFPKELQEELSALEKRLKA